MGHPTRSGRLHAATRAAQSRRGAEHVSPNRRAVCDELKVSRRTFDRWRAQCSGPRSVRLGGSGPVRVRRSWLEEWIEAIGRGTT